MLNFKTTGIAVNLFEQKVVLQKPSIENMLSSYCYRFD